MNVLYVEDEFHLENFYVTFIHKKMQETVQIIGQTQIEALRTAKESYPNGTHFELTRDDNGYQRGEN